MVQDFASMRIGPEPTTDNFTVRPSPNARSRPHSSPKPEPKQNPNPDPGLKVVCHGRDDSVVPGNAAVVQVRATFRQKYIRVLQYEIHASIYGYYSMRSTDDS